MTADPPSPTDPTAHSLQPGLLVLHGNRAETLADTVIAWTLRHPLAPLEEEVFLVQSNGVAEWLKMAVASQAGICAATRVELPARFLWRAYRQVLGRDAVPAQSALDKAPLAWRLLQQLPQLALEPGFEPLAGFLRGGDLLRRWQLAQKLADLFDQYQVYRSDWLDAWADGRDLLGGAAQGASASSPVPTDQRWQPALWRALLEPLVSARRAATRPQLHTRFLRAIEHGFNPARLPRRVVLFGMTHVPMQTLQALAALSQHVQVLLAVPNPCRYHWADIIDGRDLLRAQRRRLPLRGGRELSAVPLPQMHAHAHPLLAAWGRQSRDFVRQLDAFDDAAAARERFPVLKLDLFDEGPGRSLLQQVQARIRDLVPLAEHAALNTPVDDRDRSIVFQVAHGPQREVEILHDQLLQLLAEPAQARDGGPDGGTGGTPLAPRDIVVMVPDVETFAPAIRSVFGQHSRSDARHIPFDIADLQERGHQPLLVAVEWLARLPQQRCSASELRDLLDVPAVAARFGIDADADADAIPRLTQWVAGAGIRWGLDASHRSSLGLGAAGEQNTWLFGLRRMLLGYASGNAADQPFDGVVPYAEVGGLEAALAGSLAELLQVLMAWRNQAASEATPLQWAERWRALMAAMLLPSDDAERAAQALLEQALSQWLQACEAADFDAPVPLAVAREAWLAGLDGPALNRRFRAGGVTFCTLLPMRSIPFEVVCLLGMNDGDYPRSSPRNDFDLMALPGQARPGDRSRREDDRQLMLEALLSARRVLSISWTGRSVRDNSLLPPSVLVSQLRDHLAAGWGDEVLAQRTTEHPLQPFSRRYFEKGVEQGLQKGGETSVEAGSLFTHAREWRMAHVDTRAQQHRLHNTQGQHAQERTQEHTPAHTQEQAAPAVLQPDTTVLTVGTLAAFLRNPVRHFFRTRLAVVFADDDDALDDDEVFSLDGLQQHGLLDVLLRELQDAEHAATADTALDHALDQALTRLRLAGQLPIANTGLRSQQALADTLRPMLQRWQALQAQWPVPAPRQPLRCGHAGWTLDDWLDGLQLPDNGVPDAGGEHGTWLQLLPQTLSSKKGVAAGKLVEPWVRMLAASACGLQVRGVLLGRDAVLRLPTLPQAEAQQALAALLAAHAAGQTEPLPLARDTALAWLSGGDPAAAYDGGQHQRAEGGEPCLQRVFPDFAALRADGRFSMLAADVYGPLWRWAQGAVRLEALQ